VNPYAGAVRAPDFPEGLQWVNSAPLSMHELRGRYVVLDFWTAGCINCIHEIPHLERLQHEYPYEVAVVGVQSAKYTAEGEFDNLVDAVHRYGIEHPVVNDPDYAVWSAYAVNAWPTLVFVSPDGKVIGSHSGELPFDSLDRVIGGLIAKAFETAPADQQAPKFEPVHWSRPANELSFPGKVLAVDGRLFIADTSHNRVVEASQNGEVRRVFGHLQAGFSDGPAEDSRFRAPQGMCVDLDGTTLYVADAGNHAVRAVDLASGTISTVAGTGEQTMRYVRGGPALETSLSSPWEVTLMGDTLLVAMAGLHQIWVVDVTHGMSRVWAGTGHEGLRDGSRRDAWFSQPTGLSSRDGRLYIACAEAQGVRQIDLAADSVSTLAGTGLFDFGDVDGGPSDALLQHCQGISAGDGTVYVADTYNNKIKEIDLESGLVTTLAGSGERGNLDGPADRARLTQPAGLSLDGGTLYIADTGNHAVRSLDLHDRHVRTIRVTGLTDQAL
jgi:thiol-disulfide isomerase/thioredoxin